MKCCFVDCANEGDPEPGDPYFACEDCLEALDDLVAVTAYAKQHAN